jgi:hypothetical protein
MLMTLILDYAGGTYVSQVEVNRLEDLALKLRSAFEWQLVTPHPAPSALDRFIDSIAESNAMEISGVRQVWCMSAMLGRKLALIHAVNTAEGVNELEAAYS